MTHGGYDPHQPPPGQYQPPVDPTAYQPQPGHGGDTGGYTSPMPTDPGQAPFTQPGAPPPWMQAPAPPPYPSPYPPSYPPPYPPPPQKSAAVAVALSFLWPGIGQLYLGRIGLGVAFICIQGFWFLISLTIIGLVISVPAGYLTVLAAAATAAQQVQYGPRPGAAP